MMQPAVIAKMCGTKKRHTTAKDAAKAIEYHRLAWRTPMRSYKCPVCSGWHLSKKETT